GNCSLQKAQSQASDCQARPSQPQPGLHRHTDVEFVAVDMPEANKLTVHILAAMAEHEREQISARTKAALMAAKRRGKQMQGGSPPTFAPSSRRSGEAAKKTTMRLPPSSTSPKIARRRGGPGRRGR